MSADRHLVLHLWCGPALHQPYHKPLLAQVMDGLLLHGYDVTGIELDHSSDELLYTHALQQVAAAAAVWLIIIGDAAAPQGLPRVRRLLDDMQKHAAKVRVHVQGPFTYGIMLRAIAAFEPA